MMCQNIVKRIGFSALCNPPSPTSQHLASNKKGGGDYPQPAKAKRVKTYTPAATANPDKPLNGSMQLTSPAPFPTRRR